MRHPYRNPFKRYEYLKDKRRRYKDMQKAIIRNRLRNEEIRAERDAKRRKRLGL